MKPVVIPFNHNDPNLKAIRDVAQEARAGKIVAFPTETVYGIGALASNAHAIRRIYAIKDRDPGKPLAYHLADFDQLMYLNVSRTPAFRYLTKKFWPGPLTLIASTEKGEKIGIRFPRSVPTAAFLSGIAEPFLATSANRAGDASPVTAQEVIRNLGAEIDYLIDSGPTEYGQDSTVVDITGDPPKILREGAEAAQIREAVEDIRQGRIPRKKIMVVCTGNSCRSPMAAGFLKHELRRKRLDREIEVVSSGILARDGGAATPEAALVMKNREIDITGHRSRSCRREEILESDLILAMSKEHEDFLTGLVPGIKNKIKVWNIRDPIGHPIPVYEDVAQELEKKIKAEWNDLVK